MLARFLFIPIALSTNGNMVNGNLNSRTRPHLEENLAKSLKDQSKFNRAQATKLSCRSSTTTDSRLLPPQWLSTPDPPPSDPLYCNWHHVALLLFSRFLLTQSFYCFTALWAAHACNHFTKPVYTPHGALGVLLHRQLPVIHLMFTVLSGKQLYSSVHHCQR